MSKDGKEWTLLTGDMDVSSLHHNNYGGFYALRVGRFSAGKGSAGFSRFRYRNAVPQDKDMSAYLMVFHKDEDHGLHRAISPDGYTFTALNEGKPVIAGDTIAEQKGIREMCIRDSQYPYTASDTSHRDSIEQRWKFETESRLLILSDISKIYIKY